MSVEADQAAFLALYSQDGEVSMWHKQIYSDAEKLPPVTDIATIILDISRDREYQAGVVAIFLQHSMPDMAKGIQQNEVDALDQVLASLYGDGRGAYGYFCQQRDFYTRSYRTQLSRLGPSFVRQVTDISDTAPNRFADITPEFIQKRLESHRGLAKTYESYAQIVSRERGFHHSPIQVD